MAFKSVNNRKFYIVPKHSTKELVLGVDNETMWSNVKLMKQDATSPFKQFMFEKWGQSFVIRMGNVHMRYAMVHNRETGSHAHGRPAPIIEGEITGTDPMRFRLLPAGNGFYRIQGEASNCVWDVLGATDDENTVVVQGVLNSGNNQLFAIVPVPNQNVAPTLASLEATNNLLRTGVMGIIGLVPDVGKALGFVIGFFWKDNSFSDLWGQMQTYVEARIKAEINQKTLIDLGVLLEEILLNVQTVNDDPTPGKGETVKALYQKINGKKAWFKACTQTGVLPYLINFGNIYIMVSRMLVVNQADLFKETLSADQKANFQKNLNDAIDFMKQQVLRVRNQLIIDRMAAIDSAIGVQTGYDYESKYGIGFDSNDGLRHEWARTRTGSDISGPTDYAARSTAWAKYRKLQARTQFESELDVILDVTELWPDFNPLNTPRTKVTIRKDVADFGSAYAHNTFFTETPQGGRITRLKVYSGDYFCGIECWVNGVSRGLKGVAGKKFEDLLLDADEHISSVWGFSHDVISAVYFATNKGRVIGGGVMNGSDQINEHYFTGDLADGLNARLVNIYGAYNNHLMERLSFTWEYQGYAKPPGNTLEINLD